MVRLGCRSASFLVYGVLSTIVWILLVSSSILTHYATMQPLNHWEQPVNDWSMRAARLTSIFPRRLGKLIATLQSIWIFISCMFQLSNFYDGCYCNSDVFWLRGRAYNVIQLMADDLAGAKGAWLGGVSGGRGCGDLCWVRRVVQGPTFAGLTFASVAFLVSWDVTAPLPSCIVYCKLYL